MYKPIVDIDRWAVGTIQGQKVLFGVPSNHPGHGGRVSNARLIISSPIVRDERRWGYVETMNTHYQLGPTELDLDNLDDVCLPHSAAIVREALRNG